jgi:aminomethyltransferase
MLKYVLNQLGEEKEIKGSPVLFAAHSLESDYGNIRNGVGIFPLTFTSFFKVNADEYEEQLDTLLTKSIQYLNYGQNRLCYFLSEFGEIEAFTTIYKNDDSYIIEAFDWDADKLSVILESANIQFEKLDYSCILFEGVCAEKFITEDLELPVDYYVYQSHQEVEYCQQSLIIARTGYTGEYGYKFIGETGSIKTVWEELLPKHSDKLVGYAAFELCQYEIKQPSWELPYLASSSNIFEVDYHWFVDFKKDIDYTGKVALYETNAKQVKNKIIGAISETENTIGEAILLDGESIGKVIDSRFSIGLNKYISMLLVDKDYAHANIPLVTGSGQELTTASAPYVYPSSWSAKK